MRNIRKEGRSELAGRTRPPHDFLKFCPHPRDASGEVDCVRVKFYNCAASFEFKISYRVAVTIKFTAKFKILWYLALYFSKYL